MRWVALLAIVCGATACALSAAEVQAERAAKVEARAKALLEEALNLAQRSDNPIDRAEAIGTAAAILAQFDPKRALDLAQSVLTCYDSAVAMGEAAIQIAQQNEYLGLSVLGRISDKSVSYDMFVWALLYRARQSVPDALELAGKVDDPAVRNVIMLQVTPLLAAWNPKGPKAAAEAALEWVKAYPFEAPKPEGMAYVAAAQAKYDLPGAVKLAGTLPGSDADLARRLIAAAIAPTSAAKTREIIATIKTPREYCRAVIAAAPAIGQTKPAEALALLQAAAKRANDIDDARHQGEVRHDLALLLAPHEFEAALALAEAAWPLQQKASAMEGLVAVLAAKDPERAQGIADDLRYEASFMTDPLQRSVAYQYAMLAQARLDPAKALKALAEIAEPDIRQECLQALAIELAPRDPDRADRITQQMTDARARDETYRLAAVACAASRPAQAERLADKVRSLGGRSKALAGIARAILLKEGLLADAIARPAPLAAE